MVRSFVGRFRVGRFRRNRQRASNARTSVWQDVADVRCVGCVGLFPVAEVLERLFQNPIWGSLALMISVEWHCRLRLNRIADFGEVGPRGRTSPTSAGGSPSRSKYARTEFL